MANTEQELQELINEIQSAHFLGRFTGQKETTAIGQIRELLNSLVMLHPNEMLCLMLEPLKIKESEEEPKAKELSDEEKRQIDLQPGDTLKLRIPSGRVYDQNEIETQTKAPEFLSMITSIMNFLKRAGKLEIQINTQLTNQS